MPTVAVEDRYPGLVPLSRQENRRLIWRQAQERARDLRQALGPFDVVSEPLGAEGGKAGGETYLGLPVARGFRRFHRFPDGQEESLVLPNRGPDEIDLELRDYLEDQSLDENAPPLRLAAEVEAWAAAASAREREEGKLFGAPPPYVLVDPSLDGRDWYGSYVVFTSRKDPDVHWFFTSGLSDRDLQGEPTRHTRDYELYVEAGPGAERWALNVLGHLVRAVLDEHEDHLAAVRSARHAVVPSLSVPGLPGVWGVIMGVRTSLPRALPIAGGATKLIPVTIIHPEEVEHGEREGFEELATLLLEEGDGILSDPSRGPVVTATRKRGWKLW